ncbi:ribosome maturation factor RimP [candidate division KSB1 bacterium]|nr:ribosome maturation factor RimP [candidate division KSB1 bacterium]RQW05506.1 MAG: ribosome maturation factor RimP [candidate division KSB1 bacterium]
MDKLEEIIKPVLDEMGVELVELQYNRSKRSSLRLFVWEEGGISIDRCTAISRTISDLLDRKDVIDGRYILEVSSPGIDRPLVVQRDFERQIGRLVRIKLLDENKSRIVKGRIDAVNKNIVRIAGEKESIDIRLDEIESAKVMVEF